MCGIAGVFVPKTADPVRPNLDAMAGIMRHRGPDGEGRYSSADNRFHGVFRRLAIIDLKTGDQPIIEANGSSVLFGNGEIYNYIELRQTLKDYPFKTEGDMEAVLPLKRRDPDGYVHALNGMYALAIYDVDDHSLELVRDRMGVKPVYWARTRQDGIVYGSEIKPLLASGLVEAEVDSDAANAYLAHGYVPSPKTLLKGIHKLPAGHRLKINAKGHIEITRYWRPTPERDIPEDNQGIQAHLDELIGDSVRMQLRSDVPIGVLLSGGLDSGMVVAHAAAITSHKLNTFTARFEGGGRDESPMAAEVAARFGTEHRTLTIGANDAAALMPQLAWYAEEPLADAALLPNFLIERALGDHVTVALNGTGGDEMFAGYGRYFQLPIEQQYLKVPAAIRHGLIEPMAETFAPMRAWQLSRAELFNADRGRYLHAHSTQFPGPIRDMIGNRMTPPGGAQSEIFANIRGGFADDQSAALATDMDTYLVDDLLLLLDRTSMAVSIEGRVPMLDHRLVEAALAVPPEIRTPGGRQKGLQRAMAAKLLPESVVSAPKHGFVSPVPSWMAGHLGELARNALTRPQALERGWWTQDGIDRLLADRPRHGYRLYALLTLELAIITLTEGPLATSAPHTNLETFLHDR
tara:strand:- start:718 stop:2619 length:1902 start_codon:yes stop_codon:yes gene_type:complete